MISHRLNLGAVLHVLGKFDEAEQVYLKALHLSPNHPLTTANLQRLRNSLQNKNHRNQSLTWNDCRVCVHRIQRQVITNYHHLYKKEIELELLLPPCYPIVAFKFKYNYDAIWMRNECLFVFENRTMDPCQSPFTVPRQAVAFFNGKTQWKELLSLR